MELNCALLREEQRVKTQLQNNKELDLEVVSSLAAKKNSKGNMSIIISWYYMFQVLGTPQPSPLLSVWVSDVFRPSDVVLKHIILHSFLKD